MHIYDIQYQHTDDRGYLTGSVLKKEVTAPNKEGAIELVRDIGDAAAGVGVRILKVTLLNQEGPKEEGKSSGMMGRIVMGFLGVLMLLQMMAGQ